MATLVGKSEFARLAGVSPAAVTKAVVRQLKAAMVGPRIDLDHPDTQKYLAEGDRRALRSNARLFAPTPDPPAPRPPTKPPEANPFELPKSPTPKLVNGRVAQPAAPRPAPAPAPAEDPEDVSAYLDLTLRELMRRFGTQTAFRDLLAATKQIADIEEKKLKNAERVGKLISREFVRVHLLAYLATASRGLLQDTAVTLAQRMYSMCRAGIPVEQAEQIARDLIGAQLRQAKEQIRRVLGGEQQPEVDAA